MNAFWNFMTVSVAICAALIPVAWAWHYDRYRRSLDRYEHWVSWITALNDEVEHQLSSLAEMQDGFQQMLQRKQFGAITKRFNDDLFRSAREQIIQHQRAPHIFLVLTRTFRDTAHTNAMLDRFEAALLKDGSWDEPLANSIGSSVRGSLAGVDATLTEMRSALEEEIRLFESIRPRLHNAQ
ncbi:MAG: hypothetical protein H7A51_13475 [Akkermansiaceae bacterium]|nr:hypothetical protein [Akkermansiaceae bacterium]